MHQPPSRPPSGVPQPWAPRGPSQGPAPAPSGPPTGGGWVAPGGQPATGSTRPWAPAGWGPATTTGAPTVGAPTTGAPGGLPPHPPGYDATAPAGAAPAGGPGLPAAQPAGPDRGGRLASALVGALVGAVVAALIATGLTLAVDDDPAATTSTTTPRATGVGADLDIRGLLDEVQPTVVSIYISEGGQTVGAGSGFVYDAEEGLILTNAHVIEGAEDISVTFFDGSAQGAEVVGAFPEDDVAMIRVPNTEGLREATLGSSDALEVGEDVVAIGNALGLGGDPTVTTGIVSAKDRTIPGDGFTLTNLIQTDAAINSGNSGGPLLNARREVVGINTAKIPDASNIGFALAIDALRPLIDELEAGHGAVNEDQAFLGVSTVPLEDADLPPEVLDQFGITSREGLIVVNVTAGSAADVAGFQQGDIVLAVDGEPIDTNEALGEIIREKDPGDTITITRRRNGEDSDVEVTLQRRGG